MWEERGRKMPAARFRTTAGQWRELGTRAGWWKDNTSPHSGVNTCHFPSILYQMPIINIQSVTSGYAGWWRIWRFDRCHFQLLCCSCASIGMRIPLWSRANANTNDARMQVSFHPTINVKGQTLTVSFLSCLKLTNKPIHLHPKATPVPLHGMSTKDQGDNYHRCSDDRQQASHVDHFHGCQW
jgi:hypothetical protein